jgi:hypothetical protein
MDFALTSIAQVAQIIPVPENVPTWALLGILGTVFVVGISGAVWLVSQFRNSDRAGADRHNQITNLLTGHMATAGARHDSTERDVRAVQSKVGALGDDVEYLARRAAFQDGMSVAKGDPVFLTPRGGRPPSQG